ncbi:MAG: Smr/MutS family protein [Alphaproteobacteria bacterium]|nr:Smr/MutS family protein [Alphaproteobacteria bacterium]
MKQLTDKDIAEMIGTDFTPDDATTRHSVRSELHLSQRIPHQPIAPPQHATLDLHQFTEEQAWTAIMELAQSGTRTANIITGASGILKIKFQQWARDSILSPYIISFKPINNGSFVVKFKKHEKTNN